MSDTQEATPAPDGTRGSKPGAPTRERGSRLPDRRNTHRWVPQFTGWFCLLLGLDAIVHVVRLSSITHGLSTAMSPPVHHLAHRLHVTHLHRFAHSVAEAVPGLLTNATHVTDVIIGLML